MHWSTLNNSYILGFNLLCVFAISWFRVLKFVFHLLWMQKATLSFPLWFLGKYEMRRWFSSLSIWVSTTSYVLPILHNWDWACLSIDLINRFVLQWLTLFGFNVWDWGLTLGLKLLHFISIFRVNWLLHSMFSRKTGKNVRVRTFSTLLSQFHLLFSSKMTYWLI